MRGLGMGKRAGLRLVDGRCAANVEPEVCDPTTGDVYLDEKRKKSRHSRLLYFVCFIE